MGKDSWKDYYSKENIDFLGDIYLDIVTFEKVKQGNKPDKLNAS